MQILLLGFLVSCVTSAIPSVSAYPNLESDGISEKLRIYVRDFIADPIDRRSYDILTGFDKPQSDLNDFFLAIRNDLLSKIYLDAIDHGILHDNYDRSLFAFQGRNNPRTGKTILFDKIKLNGKHSSVQFLQDIRWEFVSELETEFKEDLPWDKMNSLRVLKLSFLQSISRSFNLFVIPPIKKLVINAELANVVSLPLIKRLCFNGLEEFELLGRERVPYDTATKIIRTVRNFCSITSLVIDDDHAIQLLESYSRLASADRLRSVELRGSLDRFSTPLGFMSSLTGLRKLRLEAPKQPSWMVEMLKTLPQLESLSLRMNTLQKEALSVISNLPYLKELQISTDDSKSIVDHLKPEAQLENLDIAVTRYTGRFLYCDRLVNLKHVRLIEVLLDSHCMTKLASLESIVLSSIYDLPQTATSMTEISVLHRRIEHWDLQHFLRLFNESQNLEVIRYDLVNKPLQRLSALPHTTMNHGTHLSVKIYRPE